MNQIGIKNQSSIFRVMLPNKTIGPHLSTSQPTFQNSANYYCTEMFFPKPIVFPPELFKYQTEKQVLHQ